jgi:hypothetical protein
VAVTGPAVAGGALDGDRQRAGGRRLERVEVDLGEPAVEADGLVGHGQRQPDGDVGADDTELAGSDGDAGLAPAIDGVEGCRLRRRAHGDADVDVTQVARRPHELELFGLPAELVGGVEELSAGRVPAGPAVVVRRVPVSDADEQHGVDRLGDVGVAEPDRLPTFLTASAHPAGQLGQRLPVVHEHGLHEAVPAGEEELTSGLRRGDGSRRHQGRDLADGLDSQLVGARMGRHVAGTTWRAHQAYRAS